MKKVRREITNVTTPIGCKKINGQWDTKNGVCVHHTDNKSYGLFAPIRGVTFAYWAVDLESEWPDIDEEFKGKYAPRVIACPIEHFEFFPEFDWLLCNRSVYDNWEEADIQAYGWIMNQKKAFAEAKTQAVEVFKDVKEGRAKDWSMRYLDKKGKQVCIGPRCKTIDSMHDPQIKYDPSERKEGFSFRRKHA